MFEPLALQFSTPRRTYLLKHAYAISESFAGHKSIKNGAKPLESAGRNGFDYLKGYKIVQLLKLPEGDALKHLSAKRLWKATSMQSYSLSKI